MGFCHTDANTEAYNVNCSAPYLTGQLAHPRNPWGNSPNVLTVTVTAAYWQVYSASVTHFDAVQSCPHLLVCVEAEARKDGPFHDQAGVQDAHVAHGGGAEGEAAVADEGHGRQQDEGQDGDDGEQVDVVQGALGALHACGSTGISRMHDSIRSR